MKTICKLFALSFCLFSLSVSSQIIHVPEDYPTIQEGIDAAVNGDTVLVDAGTYLENINFNGKAIMVASQFVLDNNTNHINNTIIDGSQPEDPSLGSVITFMSGEDTTSTILGFTITGGTGLEIASQRMGGGVVCFKSGARISNNKIIANEITFNGMTPGGGICSFIDVGEAWIIVENNTISGNVCTSIDNQAFGGGIAVGTNARIVNNQIFNNKCFASVSNGLSSGGGLHIESGLLKMDSVVVASNSIHNNKLESYYCYGAGVYNSTSILNLSDNILNANSTIGTYCYGSAVFIRDVVGEVTIDTNMIVGNSHKSDKVGAATISIWSYIDSTSQVIIKQNSIINNSASANNYWGTAIWLRDLGDFFVEIDGNLIEGNEGYSGSGLWTRSSFNYRLTNNIFSANEVDNIGGAIYSGLISREVEDIFLFKEKSNQKRLNLKNNGSYRPFIANNTFVGNYSGDLGGAVYLAGNYNSLCPVFINNIFYENTADGMDYEIHHAGIEELLISNNNIDINRIYGYWDGNDNIAGDPELDTLFHIDFGSICYNAGIQIVEYDGRWYMSPTVDFEDDSRPLEGGFDIGADETYDPTGVELVTTGYENLKIYIHPNPFTTSTTIEYELTHPQTVTIIFYNQFGKQVDRIEQKQSAGKQQVAWNAESQPAGIYYFRLEADGRAASGKMVLMR